MEDCDCKCCQENEESCEGQCECVSCQNEVKAQKDREFDEMCALGYL
jgi:hypothetical protein